MVICIEHYSLTALSVVQLAPLCMQFFVEPQRTNSTYHKQGMCLQESIWEGGIPMSLMIITEICKAGTPRLKALNKRNITRVMYIEMENITCNLMKTNT